MEEIKIKENELFLQKVNFLMSFPTNALIPKERERQYIVAVHQLTGTRLYNFLLIVENGKRWPQEFSEKLVNHYLLGGKSAYSNENLYTFQLIESFYECEEIPSKNLYNLLTNNILKYPKIQKLLVFIKRFSDFFLKVVHLTRFFEMNGMYEFPTIELCKYSDFGFSIDNKYLIMYCTETEFNELDEKKKKTIIEYEYSLLQLAHGIPDYFFPNRKRYNKNTMINDSFLPTTTKKRTYNQLKDTYLKGLKGYEKRCAIWFHQFIFTDKHWIRDNPTYNIYDFSEDD
jgi:hypothetical protein